MARPVPRHQENRPFSGVDRDGLTKPSFESQCGAKQRPTGAIFRESIRRGNFSA